MEVAISWDQRLSSILGSELSENRDGGFLYVKPEGNFKPGAAAWLNGQDGKISTLVTVCPCGCGSLGHTAVVEGYGTRWQWDGNELKPTLSPSIQKLTVCRWHGHLRGGVFVSC